MVQKPNMLLFLCCFGELRSWSYQLNNSLVLFSEVVVSIDIHYLLIIINSRSVGAGVNCIYFLKDVKMNHKRQTCYSALVIS